MRKRGPRMTADCNLSHSLTRSHTFYSSPSVPFSRSFSLTLVCVSRRKTMSYERAKVLGHRFSIVQLACTGGSYFIAVQFLCTAIK